jgi:hypothetical protein
VQRTFIKKYFLFPVGNVCRVKRFTTEGEKSDKRLAVEEVEMEARKWLRFVCCVFRRNSKAMGQVCQCWYRIRGEINGFSFQVRISHVSHLYPF